MDNENSFGIHVGLLSDVIHELNISRNYVSAYPKGHPVIAASCEKLALHLGQLLHTREELTIGIAKDTIVIRGIQPGQNNFAFREFAGALFRHGIAAIIFRQGLKPEDIVKFNELLLEKRCDIRDMGGIEQAVSQSGIEGIRVSEVRYDAFHVTEQEILSSPARWEPSTSPWEIFARKLLAPHFETSQDYDSDTGPRLLAEAINKLYDPSLSGKCDALAESLRAFLSELAAAELPIATQTEFFRKIGNFAGHLNPELLNQFILTAIKSFDVKRPDISDSSSQMQGSDSAPSTIMGNVTLPPLVKNLVDVLAKHADTGQQPPGSPFPASQQEMHELAPKLMLLFREDRTDDFVPPQYLEALSMIVNSDAFMEDAGEDSQVLAVSLDSDCLDYALGEIIIEIMNSGLFENLGKIRETLLDIFKFCLQTGDYSSLVKLYDRTVQENDVTNDEAVEARNELLAFFAEDDFVEEILIGLDTWGKDKYTDIGTIIRKVGKPFVEPLLDRLASEQNLSARRYYLSILIDLAKAAKEPAIRRLGDPRWYVLRNLTMILRHSDDASVMRHLSKLDDHPHPKVRQNIIEAHIHFNSPESDRLLLREMRRSDPEARISAIQLAGKSSGPAICSHLLFLLQRRCITPVHRASRKAAVGALAEIGNCKAIPALEAILSRKRSLFRPGLIQLQIDIINTLDRYPDDAAIPLLDKTARSSNGLLSKTAMEKLRSMGEKQA